jgi:hypothetical protein
VTMTLAIVLISEIHTQSQGHLGHGHSSNLAFSVVLLRRCPGILSKHCESIPGEFRQSSVLDKGRSEPNPSVAIVAG